MNFLSRAMCTMNQRMRTTGGDVRMASAACRAGVIRQRRIDEACGATATLVG